MTFSPKHLLVPVDVDVMSEPALAERLVDDATSLAKTFGARITLVHVALPTTAPTLLTPDTEIYRSMLDVVEARNAASMRALKELQRRADKAGVTASVELLTRGGGSVAELIVEMARDRSVDLIVMTTHARRGLSRLFLGSVAERTAHLSRVPTLLIPPR